jgi:rhodanese-related sulfurtransferase
MKIINREGLREKIERGDDFVLLEVLSEQSYKREHLPGAIRYEGRSTIPDLLPDKTTTVVAYCSNFH